jgi:hypothetical protein
VTTWTWPEEAKLKSNIAAARNASLPAPKELILTLIARLFMHKRVENDQTNQEILLDDFTELLFGLPEYAVAMAVFETIEDDNPFLPPLGKIKQLAKSHVVEYKPFDERENTDYTTDPS